MDRIYGSITRKIIVDEYVKGILPMLSLDKRLKP